MNEGEMKRFEELVNSESEIDNHIAVFEAKRDIVEGFDEGAYRAYTEAITTLYYLKDIYEEYHEEEEE